MSPHVNDGTNCCSFLSLKTCDLWLSCPDDIKCGWESFTKPVEGVINQFPVKINPYRDTGKYYEIDESLTIMNKLSLLKNSVEISQLARLTKVFSISVFFCSMSVERNWHYVLSVVYFRSWEFSW